MNAAIAIGALCAGFIAPPVLAAAGWRGTFIVGGCVPLMIALLAAGSTPESLKFLLTRRPHDARIARIFGRLAPQLPGAVPVLPEAAAPPRASILALLAPAFRARTLMLWAVVLANLFTLWFLISWLTTLLTLAGWTNDSAVRGAVLIQAGGLVGGLALSAFVDRGKTLPALLIAFATAAASLALFAVVPSGALWVVLLALVGCGVSGAQLALNALSTAYYPPAIKATGMSWVGVAGQIGSSTAPLAGGWFIARHLAAIHILALLCVVPLLCAGATLLMRREWQGD